MLTQTDVQMLQFEKQWWHFEGSKQQAIRDTFGLTPTRYYQCLNTLLDNPEALSAEPVVVRRLQRQRQARRAKASAGI